MCPTMNNKFQLYLLLRHIEWKLKRGRSLLAYLLVQTIFHFFHILILKLWPFSPFQIFLLRCNCFNKDKMFDFRKKIFQSQVFSEGLRLSFKTLLVLKIEIQQFMIKTKMININHMQCKFCIKHTWSTWCSDFFPNQLFSEAFNLLLPIYPLLIWKQKSSKSSWKEIL